MYSTALFGVSTCKKKNNKKFRPKYMGKDFERDFYFLWTLLL